MKKIGDVRDAWHLHDDWTIRATAQWKTLHPRHQKALADAVRAFCDRREGDFRTISTWPKATVDLRVGAFTVMLSLPMDSRVVEVSYIEIRTPEGEEPFPGEYEDD